MIGILRGQRKFEGYLMEWVTKHNIKLDNTFFDDWHPTRARRIGLNSWKMSEDELQQWKIIDYIASPSNWESRSTVARYCWAQNKTDHSPVITHVKLPEKKERWHYAGNSSLIGFGKVIVEKLEARGIEFEAAGGRGQWEKKSKEHNEAERNLRGEIGEELKEPIKNLAKQWRKYRARRIILTLQRTKNNTACQSLYCRAEEGKTRDRQKWVEELEKYSKTKRWGSEPSMNWRSGRIEWRSTGAEITRSNNSRCRRCCRARLLLPMVKGSWQDFIWNIEDAAVAGGAEDQERPWTGVQGTQQRGHCGWEISSSWYPQRKGLTGW